MYGEHGREDYAYGDLLIQQISHVSLMPNYGVYIEKNDLTIWKTHCIDMTDILLIVESNLLALQSRHVSVITIQISDNQDIQQLIQADAKGNINDANYWSFAKGIHPLHHKRPVKRKAFLFHNVIMGKEHKITTHNTVM